MTDTPFDDVLAANASYAESFSLQGLEAPARRGLAVVTCMDSRLDPHQMLGLAPGDAKVVRNAGGRVTDDVLHDLVLAVHLLQVRRIMVVPHTGCAMAQASPEVLHERIREAGGPDTRSLELRVAPDQEAALRHDVQRIRSLPYLPADVTVGGFLYDVRSGLVSSVVS